ncbi:MAG: SDR family oxidoreductase [Acidimicrobiia bacterium]|nr:SDR family oxidoreductase [Acidimicrobiia bacterium]
MFRKRANRIRGVAGSMDGATILVADATVGAGPGIVRVLAEAGAKVIAASGDSPRLDVQIHKLGDTPTPVEAIGEDPSATPDDFIAGLPNPLTALVANPELEDPESVSRHIALAEVVATSMRDHGHTGSIVLMSGIERTGPAGPMAARIQVETENRAADLAPNGIRVNAVAAGPVGANRRDSPVSNRATPLGHVTVHPVEVGKAVWFLLNEGLSAGMTGTTLKIDRGASLLRPHW